MPKDIRFVWNDNLRQAVDVPRASREFGCYMVDRRIYKSGGFCSEHNSGLAKGVGVSPRSVQRYISDLERMGWIHIERVSQNKRTIRLSYEMIQTGAGCHDGKGAAAATKLSRSHDKTGTPYNKNNHLSNNGKGRSIVRSEDFSGSGNERADAEMCFRTFTVQDDEHIFIATWKK